MKANRRPSPRGGACLPGLLFLVATLGGCESTHSDEATPRTGPWASEIAWEAGSKIGGCAVGDVDPSTPGDEVVVVTGDYRVAILRRSETGWEHEVLAQLQGEMIQCAVGELSPLHEGEEIVCVGAQKGSEDDPGRGVAMVFYRSGGRTVGAVLAESESLIHGVDISEDGRVALVGYTGTVRFCWPGDDLSKLPIVERVSEFGGSFGRGKAVVGLSDTEMVVANAEGRLLRSDGLRVEELLRSPDPLARLAVEGDRLLVCDNGGRLNLLSLSGASETLLIHDGADRLRGAVLADLSLDHPGVEAATAGYDGRVLVFDNLTERAPYEVVATDNDRLHHLATGVMAGLGRCLVAVGYGGRVHVIYRQRAE